MKINRQPLSSLPEDVFKKDHEFWSQYSGRLIGNWITYDTSVKQIADFAEKIYRHRDFSDFKGDRKFIRDDNAQKSFSKLRSSIAGIYAWRLGMLSGVPTPPEYSPKNETERQLLIKEADFALKQSFAFCPYSPEASFRYINFLTQVNRLDDALLVAQTCLKFDPYNSPIANLVKQLSDFKKQSGERVKIGTELQRMENEMRINPTNFQNIFSLAALYLQLQQTNRVIELFDQTLTVPNIPSEAVGVVAQFYAQMGNLPKLEGALEKLTTIIPNQPEHIVNEHIKQADRHKRNSNGKQINDYYLNRKQEGSYSKKMNNMTSEEKEKNKKIDKLRKQKSRELEKARNTIDKLCTTEGKRWESPIRRLT